MANNLYDYLNRFNLGQLGTAGLAAAQGAANFLNKAGIGTRGLNTPIQSRPVVNPDFMRPDYSGAGERARRFQEYQTGRDIPGANTDYSARLNSSSALPPEERAYREEVSRVAQLAAQNPELQRYEVARKAAAAQGATPEQVQSAEDLGMQIWAQKYGKSLAPKVKPGQAGYDVIQKTLYPGGAPLPALPAESIAMLNAIAPADATGIRPDITPMPGALPVFSDASDDMYQAVMGIGGALPNPATQNPSPAAASPQQSGISFADASFQTPASQRRSDLFAQLLQGIRQYGGTP